MSLKHLLKAILPQEFRSKLKRYRRIFTNNMRRNLPKTTIEELRRVLKVELGIKKGDKILVSSSFGNLNADYSPQDVINLLKDLVGEQGVIGMPYYPPMNSDEWANKGKIFDMKTTKSGMGILTNVFAKSEGVIMTCHPTKALCLWGNHNYDPMKHKNATTPFYWDSPYAIFLEKDAKSLGLGLKNIPIFHSFEDILSKTKDYYYQKRKYKLIVRDDKGVEYEVETLIHDNVLMDYCIPAGDYVNSLKCKFYKRIPFGYSFLFIADNKALMDSVEKAYKEGYTRESTLRK